MAAKKKPVPKKPAAKAPAAKKPAAKKPATKKVATKKAATKKVATKKAATKKVTPRKVATKKVTPRKVATKKKAPAAKKVAPKKVATRKAAPKKKPARKRTASARALPRPSSSPSSSSSSSSSSSPSPSPSPSSSPSFIPEPPASRPSERAMAVVAELPSERPLTDEEREAMSKVALTALAALDVEGSPEVIVARIGSFVDEVRAGERPEPQSQDVRLGLGVLWGEQIRIQVGWRWVHLAYPDGFASYALVPDDRAFACFPLNRVSALMTAGAGVNTSVPLFDSIRMGALPTRNQNAYLVIG